MSSYLRVRLTEVDAADIRQACDELLDAANKAPRQNYDLPLWDWLSLFFAENPPKTITTSNCLPHWLLTTRVGKLHGTPLYSFLRDLAQLHGLFFEGYENENVLSFLKRIGRVLHVNNNGKKKSGR